MPRGRNCLHIYFWSHKFKLRDGSCQELEDNVAENTLTLLSSTPSVYFPQNTKAPIFTGIREAAFHYYCIFRCPGIFLLITQSQGLAYTNNLQAIPRLGVTLLFVPHGNYYSQFKTKTLKFWLAFYLSVFSECEKTYFWVLYCVRMTFPMQVLGGGSLSEWNSVQMTKARSSSKE